MKDILLSPSNGLTSKAFIRLFPLLKRSLGIMILISALTLASSCEKDDTSPLESVTFTDFNADMRQLWTDHTLWTRNVIINVVDGAPGTTEAVNRLLKNQEDIGNAIKPYYGDAAGNKLIDLLKVHINTAADLLVAAKNNNTTAFNTASTKWYANGDEIATFLSTANPTHWTPAHMKEMMKKHLDLTLAEANARLSKNYTADVAAYDAVYVQILEMADMLAEGIALQFPDKF